MRKAQAALEYIVTYGCGFLVIIVVVGGLAYFGLLSPTRYIPAKCDFGPQLECVDYKLERPSAGAPSGRVYLRFRNSFGADINIEGIGTPDGKIQLAENGNICNRPCTIKKGDAPTTDFIFVNNNPDINLTQGDRITIPLVIMFNRTKGGPAHNITGEIFATVQ